VNKRKMHDDGAGSLARLPWLRMAVFLFVCFGVVFPFTKTGKDAVRAIRGKRTRIKIVEKRVEVPVKVKEKEPSTPAKSTQTQPVIPARKPIIQVDKDADIRKLTSGFHLKYRSHFTQGGVASQERKRNDSYVATFLLDVKKPKAAQKVEELSRINSQLFKMFPKLEQMVKSSKVSPFYKRLYNNKESRLRRNVLSLDKLLTMHNFYDCETMLELQDPETKRKVFLMVADMDVVTDGSDGDRLAEMEDGIVHDVHYQPFTSYGWRKTTNKENPMIAGWKARIENAKREINSGTASRDRISWLRSRIRMLKRGIEDMKHRSYLIAEHDPFIVISIDILRSSSANTYAPRVGDYVAVVHGDKIYPAIVGDGGPTFKCGEGSLRLAREINPRAGPNSRPVSDLSVIYLVFPSSADTVRSAPNYADWHKKCAKLIDEIGGLGESYKLHQWSNTLPQPEQEPEYPEAAEAGNGETQGDGETHAQDDHQDGTPSP